MISLDDDNKRKTQISIRINSQVLDQIKQIAQNEGIPYQTLIGSYLHKVANGQMVDKHTLT